MTVNTKIYDRRFFANTIKFEKQSARAVAEILTKYFAPKSVVDIGCGPGIYLAEFKKSNIAISGFDGSAAAIASSLVGDKIKRHDLCRPLKLSRRFDLCLCFEVAEHLEKTCAEVLVGTLTSLSQIIIFTAATPGQGPESIGHINEQPRRYWQKLFRQKKFFLNKNLTKKIKQEMIKQNVVWWLTKNLMILDRHKSTN